MGKTCLPSAAIFWQCYLSTHLTPSFLVCAMHKVVQQGCLLLTPYTGCSKTRRETQQGTFAAPKAQVWAEDYSMANHQSGHSHQANPCHAFRDDKEGMAWRASKLREAVANISPASSHFHHRGFPRQLWYLKARNITRKPELKSKSRKIKIKK